MSHDETLIQNILQVLQTYESGPSGYILVRANSNHPLSDAEEEEAYEASEGENDEGTEATLRALTPEQMSSLIADLAEIDEEHYQNDGDGYPEASGGHDIRALLGLPPRD